MTGDPDWLDAHAELRELHMDKSRFYGSHDDRLANFTTVANVTGAPVELYVWMRIVEKAQRAINMIQSGRGHMVEEAMDVASLGLCAEALRRRP